MFPDLLEASGLFQLALHQVVGGRLDGRRFEGRDVATRGNPSAAFRVALFFADNKISIFLRGVRVNDRRACAGLFCPPLAAGQTHARARDKVIFLGRDAATFARFG